MITNMSESVLSNVGRDVIVENVYDNLWPWDTESTTLTSKYQYGAGNMAAISRLAEAGPVVWGKCKTGCASQLLRSLEKRFGSYDYGFLMGEVRATCKS